MSLKRKARHNAPLLLLSLALPLSLLTHCSGSTAGPPNQVSQCGADSDCESREPSCDGSSVASFTAHCRSGSCAWDKTETACAGSCRGGACQAAPQSCSSATDCELPRSSCNAANAVVYYTNASCDAGVCHYQQATMQCVTGCSNGGCTFTTTTTTTPPLGGFGGGGESGGGGSPTMGGASGNAGETSGGAGAGG